MANANPYSFAEAKLHAVMTAPYLKYAITSMIPVPTPGMGTMGVDRWRRCYYDPAVLDEWPIEESAATIIHEVLHIMLKHHKRAESYVGQTMDGYQLKRWNVAADLTVNQTLQSFKRIESIITAEKWLLPVIFKLPENQTVEEYYDLLEKKCKSIEIKRPGGSGADGQKKPWEQGEPDGTNANGLTEFDQMLVDRRTAEEIKQCQGGGAWGSMGADMKRWADEIIEPKVDPFKSLSAAVRYAVNHSRGHGDYTWRKMPKRQPAGGVRLPATHRPLPRITVAVDTSGSMDKDDLGKALGVVRRGLKSASLGGLRVLSGDTDARASREVFGLRNVELLGGGGTDMGRVIMAAAAEKPEPQAIILVTDGETPWPEHACRPQVVACITRKTQYTQAPPSWIRTIYLHDEAE